MSTFSRIPVTLALAAGLLATRCATSPESKPESKPLPTYSEQHTEKATAIVKAIDQSTRRVKLQAQDGQVFDFVAGPQVRNLAQVKVGDKVVVEYTESIALEVRRADGTQPEVKAAADAKTAAPGEKPAGAVTGQVTISAVVVAIDSANLRITVKGPSGNLRVLQAKDPKKVADIRVGDMVYATYTESLAISLEKAK
jgi:outer membrane lipoprotein SlyB